MPQFYVHAKFVVIPTQLQFRVSLRSCGVASEINIIVCLGSLVTTRYTMLAFVTLNVFLHLQRCTF